MNDSVAANEPTPLVHNGILYLTNTDNIMQALDARTGDLIWENHMRPPKSQAGGTGAMRNIAIYQDKIFAETTDAHLFALDARTGKTVWDVMVGERQVTALRAGRRHSRQGDSGRERMRPLQSGTGSGLLYLRVRSLATAVAPAPSRAQAAVATPGTPKLTAPAKPGSPGERDPELNMTY